MIKILLCCIISPWAMAQVDTVRSAPEWLSGSWSMEGDGRTVEEFWTPVSNGRMTGYGKTMLKGKVTERESMSIEKGPAGVLVFKAKPERQSAATFTLVTADDRSLTFADMKHDFPQRIVYRRLSEDSLYAAIEGTVNGKNRLIEFRYRRVVINAD